MLVIFGINSLEAIQGYISEIAPSIVVYYKKCLLSTDYVGYFFFLHTAFTLPFHIFIIIYPRFWTHGWLGNKK
jgi:hypothetical protein